MADHRQPDVAASTAARQPAVTAFAPGRVNLIGEHTDYNGGLALPFAIQYGITIHAEALRSKRIITTADTVHETDSFELGDCTKPTGWRAFVRGTACELQQAGYTPTGTRLRISSTVPPGAGLSSSAALTVALAHALLATADHPIPSAVDLARLCSRVENNWVDAHTGLLDPLASIMGSKDHALIIDFATMGIQPLRLDLDGHRLITVDSGEPHTNATSGYNRRRRECQAACEELELSNLRDAAWSAVSRLRTPIRQRAEHVLSENDRVARAIDAIHNGDMSTLGNLLDQSHDSLRDLYECSTPRVEATVRSLRAAGALGARMVGGGFGGRVLALMPPGGPIPAGALQVSPSAGATFSI